MQIVKDAFLRSIDAGSMKQMSRRYAISRKLSRVYGVPQIDLERRRGATVEGSI